MFPFNYDNRDKSLLWSIPAMDFSYHIIFIGIATCDITANRKMLIIFHYQVLSIIQFDFCCFGQCHDFICIIPKFTKTSKAMYSCFFGSSYWNNTFFMKRKSSNAATSMITSYHDIFVFF